MFLTGVDKNLYVSLYCPDVISNWIIYNILQSFAFCFVRMSSEVKELLPVDFLNTKELFCH